MVARGELLAQGIPAGPAKSLGTTINAAVTAAGTTQGTATALNDAGMAIVTTTPANSGVLLPLAAGQPDQAIFNAGANTLTIYPGVGEKINNGAANIGIQVAPGKGAILKGHSNRWVAVISA